MQIEGICSCLNEIGGNDLDITHKQEVSQRHFVLFAEWQGRSLDIFAICVFLLYPYSRHI